tara:strand:- start:196 stop:489 length:294 start_codon:yes stop_codon:yes gene_type:complete
MRKGEGFKQSSNISIFLAIAIFIVLLLLAITFAFIFREAIQQRKGYWREEFTARPLVNYMREGFGMDELTGVDDSIPLTSPKFGSQNFFQKLIDWLK